MPGRDYSKQNGPGGMPPGPFWLNRRYRLRQPRRVVYETDDLPLVEIDDHVTERGIA